MNCQQLPLVNVYPISESPQTATQVALAQSQNEPLRIPEVANTPLEFAEIVARRHFVNGLQMSLNSKLRNSPEYKAWKSLMPSLASVPNLRQFRTKYPNFDQNGVDSEIKQLGCILQPGQVVFHGGSWPVSGGCFVGQKYTLTRPLSTTLCAGVAGAHANSHIPRQLWVITVSPEINTPVFIFSNNSNQLLSHELEVLFASGATIECIAERRLNHHQIIEVFIT